MKSIIVHNVDRNIIISIKVMCFMTIFILHHLLSC
nr:MAG TPA: hypothetical protein [Caudoviricetes sp.]DAP53829.1 MAG TPA: hypothetical protein [Caudoviricetes sp.]